MSDFAMEWKVKGHNKRHLKEFGKSGFKVSGSEHRAIKIGFEEKKSDFEILRPEHGTIKMRLEKILVHI